MNFLLLDFFKGCEYAEQFLSRKRRRYKPIDYTPRNKHLTWDFVQEYIDLSLKMPNIFNVPIIKNNPQKSVTMANNTLSGPGQKDYTLDYGKNYFSN